MTEPHQIDLSMVDAEEQKFDFIAHYASLDPKDCPSVESKLDYWWGKTFTAERGDVIHVLGGDSLFYIHAESLILHHMTQQREDAPFTPAEPLKILYQIDAFLHKVRSAFGFFELLFIDDYQVQFDFYQEKHLLYIVRQLLLTCRKRLGNDERIHHFTSYRLPNQDGNTWSDFANENSQRPLMCFDGGYSAATKTTYDDVPVVISDRQAGDYGHVVAVDFIQKTLLCEMNVVLFAGHEFSGHRLMTSVVRWENAVTQLDADITEPMESFLETKFEAFKTLATDQVKGLGQSSGLELRKTVMKTLIANLETATSEPLTMMTLKLLTIVSIQLELPFDSRAFCIPDGVLPEPLYSRSGPEAPHATTVHNIFQTLYSVWSSIAKCASDDVEVPSEDHLLTLSDPISERIYFILAVLLTKEHGEEGSIVCLSDLFTEDVIEEINAFWSDIGMATTPFLPLIIPEEAQDVYDPCHMAQSDDESEDIEAPYVFEERAVAFDPNLVTDLADSLFAKYEKNDEPQKLKLYNRFKHLPFEEREKHIQKFTQRQKQRTKQRMVNLAKTLNGGRQLHHAIIVDKGRAHIWDMPREERIAELAKYREGYAKELADAEGKTCEAEQPDEAKSSKSPVKPNKKNAKKGVNKAQAIREKNNAKNQQKLANSDEDKKNLLISKWERAMRCADQPEKFANEVLSFATGQKRILSTFGDFPALCDRLKTKEARYEVAFLMLQDCYAAHLKYSVNVFTSPAEITLCRKSLEILFRLVQDIFTQFRPYITGENIMFIQEVLLSIGFKQSCSGIFKLWKEALETAPEKGIKPLSKPKNLADFRILPGTEGRFQLQHMATVMDRTLGSGSDPRVLFKPDAWQKDLLDIVDLQESALVVAPTASGKTFVAYYAMEQTLRLDDEAVCLFVAPTTALARQVEAEIYSRMGSKAYQKNCRSVLSGTMFRDWANDPLNCQLLVTVPECLELLLTSSSKSHRQWIDRLKYVIYDEIHCIADENTSRGKIYERLLMLTPCPFIALSATIGNTDEFHKWLTLCAAKGANKVNLIEHHERFADLRTLMYSNHEEGHLYVLNPWACLHFETIATNGLASDFYMSSNDALEFYDIMLAALKKKQRDTEAAVWCMKLDPEAFFYGSSIRAVIKKRFREYVAVMKTMFYDLVESKIVTQEFFNDIVTDLLQHKPLASGSLDASSWLDLSSKGPSAKTVKKLGGGVKTDIEVAAQEQDTSELMMTLKEALAHESSIPSGNYLIGKSFYKFINRLDSLNLLPSLVFNFSRSEARTMTTYLVRYMMDEQFNKYYGTEDAAMRTKAINKRRMDEYNTKIKAKEMSEKLKGMSRAQREDQGFDKGDLGGQGEDEEVIEKPKDIAEEFDPAFSLANPLITTASVEEIEEYLESVKDRVDDELANALRRGIGMHHEALPKMYRVAVEQLFRLGYLKVVVTGTSLSLGVNMPCRTAVFAGDNLNLTPVLYKQTSGRSGRRGYDGVGNVVFWDFGFGKVQRLLSTTLSRLTGSWPVDHTFVARSANLLATLEDEAECNEVRANIEQLYKTPLFLINNMTGANEDEQKVIAEHYGSVTTSGYHSSMKMLEDAKLTDSEGFPAGFNSVLISLYSKNPDNLFLSWLLNCGIFHDIFGDNEPEDAVKTMMYMLSKIVVRKVFPPSFLKETRFHKSSAKDSNAPHEKMWKLSKGHTYLKKFNATIRENIQQYLAEVGTRTPLNVLEEYSLGELGLKFDTKASESSFQPIFHDLGEAEALDTKLRTMYSMFSMATGLNDQGEMKTTDIVFGARKKIPIEASMINQYETYKCVDIQGNKRDMTSDYINSFMSEPTLKNIIVNHGISPSDAWYIVDEWRQILTALDNLCDAHRIAGSASVPSDAVSQIISSTSSHICTLLKGVDS